MRTDDLITMLAAGAGAVRPHQAARRYATAIAWGIAGAAILMLLLLGPRHDLARAIFMPLFQIKIAFVASFAAVSFVAAWRLSRPGLRVVWVPWLLGLPVFAIWLIAVVMLVQADAAQRKVLFLGETWNSCPWLIAMLSAPLFVALIWAMRGLAPTRLRLAGAAAGLLAGALGTVVYCVHCPEIEPPFVAFWYLLGILIPTAIGALFGPRLLRW